MTQFRSDNWVLDGPRWCSRLCAWTWLRLLSCNTAKPRSDFDLIYWRALFRQHLKRRDLAHWLIGTGHSRIVAFNVDLMQRTISPHLHLNRLFTWLEVDISISPDRVTRNSEHNKQASTHRALRHVNNIKKNPPHVPFSLPPSEHVSRAAPNNKHCFVLMTCSHGDDAQTFY